MNLDSQHVLIVEDEIFVAAHLEDIVRDAGGNVVGPAMSALEALRLAKTETITVAILDVRLGDHDSLLVARHLTDAKIPFVFHTGNADTRTLSSAWPQVPVVTKPSSPHALLSAVITVLAGK